MFAPLSNYAICSLHLCSRWARGIMFFGLCVHPLCGHICIRIYLHTCSPRTLIQQLHWLPIKHRIDFKIANVTFRTLHSSQPAYLRSSLHPSHSTRSLRLSNTNLLSVPFVRTSFGTPASVLQPLKSGTLSLYLSVPEPVLTPSVVISRPATASRPSDPLNPSPLAPQIRLC